MDEQRLLRVLRTQLRHEHGDVEVLYVHASQDAPHGRLAARPTAYQAAVSAEGGAMM